MSAARFAERYGKCAIVAGASTGLGAAFARELAARKLELLLLARRKDALDALAAELRAAHGVAVRTAAVDLGAADLLSQLRAAAAGLDVGLVVYNAAHSLIGPFLEQPLDEKLRIIDVNCRGPLVFADEFGRAMAARGRGGIVFMASMAAAQGSPLVATYAATKAFDLVLAEGLWDELGAHGVDVIACRAGATRTPNYEASKPSGKVPLMEPEAVARRALDSLGKRPSVVPGFVNRLGDVFMTRLLSRRAAIRFMGKTTRRLYTR
ncbi:MAG TPA: SDR family NAD(P)-dependent oxidoreductase [Polyangia bacterium]|nr:SDR family NAD(P)-dependent oxidoreductase [Polyangia bacterium]